MKKMLSVVLALLLAVTLPISVRAAEATNVLGDWYGTLFGISVTLTLAEDGTYKMVTPIDEDDVNEGTWELKEDKIIMDGDEDGALTIEGETLTISQDDMSITFTREPVEAFTAADPKTDATQDDYQGGWLGTQVSMFGMTLDCASADLDFALEINGTDVSMISAAMGMEETIPFEFKDGAFVLDAATLAAIQAAVSEETEAAEASADNDLKIQLLQDGTARASVSFLGQSVDFYMNPATAEEIEAAKAAAAAAAASGAEEGIAENVEEAIEGVEEAIEEAVEDESDAD